jgi:integral membrane sensor domain MASE1
MKPMGRYLLVSLLLTGGYVAAFRIGQIGYGTGSISPIWPPSGLVLATFLLLGLRYWPAFILGEVLTMLFKPIPPLELYHTYNAVVFPAIYAGAAYVLRRFLRFENELERERDVLFLVALAAPITAALSAIFGMAGLFAVGILPRLPLPALWQSFWTWSVGDVVGAAVVAPILLTLKGVPWTKPAPARILEAAGITACVFGVGIAMFHTGVVPAYAVFPPLIWAALRFGPRGATGTVLVVTGMTIAYTIRGAGPFTAASVTESLAALETFTVIVATTTLLLSAATSERHTAQAKAAALDSELDSALGELRSVSAPSPPEDR